MDAVNCKKRSIGATEVEFYAAQKNLHTNRKQWFERKARA